MKRKIKQWWSSIPSIATKRTTTSHFNDQIQNSNYKLRNNQNYVPPRCRLRTSACSFIPSTVSLWNNLDISIRNSPTISLFKNRVKGDIYTTTEYYNEGSRKLNILHTRLRKQCSSLYADLSLIHVINNYKCNCGDSFEDAIHYFLECPLIK